MAMMGHRTIDARVLTGAAAEHRLSWREQGRKLIRIACVLLGLAALTLALLAVVAAPLPLFLAGHTVLASIWAGAVILWAAMLALVVRAIGRNNRSPL